MNRKARRAALNSNDGGAERSPDIDRLIAQARQFYADGQLALGRDICRRILARAPSHAVANNLLGAILQALGRDKDAIKHFTKAIASDENAAIFHHNIGGSYQRLGLRIDAMRHFTRAIALGMDGERVEDFLMRDAAVSACLGRIAQQWPRRPTIESLFGADGIAAVADNVFLCCALEKTGLCNLDLEGFLAAVRFALLQSIERSAPEFGRADDKALGFFSAVAQQCFINEYVLAQSDEETQKADALRVLLLERLAAADAVPPMLPVCVAAYFPLHALAVPASQWRRDWPPVLNDLLRQQVFEPLEERELRSAIPALTGVANEVSLQVKQQYEENPYPRWTTMPEIATADGWHARFAGPHDDSGNGHRAEILVAGCGTGQQSIATALQFPAARVLAVDLSAASLAYALRRTREAGIANVEYAQADIVNLGSLGRTFDRIEAVGVLHHLADPRAGWRVLLSLLRPNAIMDVGLYSDTARRAIVAARAFAAERGYSATPEGIRLFRRELRQHADSRLLRDLLASKDFYTVSGCRDLLFHVMEHRFSIPDIKAFLSDNGLAFLGFRVKAGIREQFHRQFPDPAALTDLDCWHAFEQSNPQTFAAMYRFAIRKDRD